MSQKLDTLQPNIGTPKTINFPFGTNGKLMVLSAPILKHFRVSEYVFNTLCSNTVQLYLNYAMQSAEIILQGHFARAVSTA